jgi:hypothetical protein
LSEYPSGWWSHSITVALLIVEEGGGRGMMMAGGWVNGWLSSPSESFDDSDQSGGDVMGDVLV